MIITDPNEQLYFAIRKHWFIFVSEVFFVILLIALPIGVYIFLEWSGLSDVITFQGNGLSFGIGAAAAWLLLIWMSAFVIWTDYYLDMLILTNKKVVDIEQKALFSRSVSTFRLDRIQDITVDVHGILPTILGFGRIHIQTAGVEQDFMVKGLPRPYQTKDRIMKAVQQAYASSDPSSPTSGV